MDNDRDLRRHLCLLHICPAPRHEGDLPACKVLHVSVLCPARICAVPRRRDTVYSGDRLCGCRKSCSEFPRPRNLHGSISRGRTVRQTILGGYACSVSATFLSFSILGNYSLGLQVSGKLDVMAIYAAGSDIYTTIIAIIQTLPLAPFVLVLLIVAMVAFYATSFDSIALVASSYTYRQITGDEEPHNAVKAFWAILLILLPMALVFSDSSMANLQSVSIIAAFPVAFVILLIIASFLKDASDYLKS